LDTRIEDHIPATLISQKSSLDSPTAAELGVRVIGQGVAADGNGTDASYNVTVAAELG